MKKILDLKGYGTDKWVLVSDFETTLGEYGEPDTTSRTQVYKLLYNPIVFTSEEGEIIWYSSELYCTTHLDEVLDLISEIITNTQTVKDFDKWCERRGLRRNESLPLHRQ